MKKIILSLILAASCQFGNPVEARGLSSTGGWVASGGFGFTMSPTLVLFNPQMEYIYDPHIYIGPMIQAAVGDATLVTFSGTVRYFVGDHPKFKPCVEGDLGLAVGSSYFGSSAGLHLGFGMGFEWVLEPNLRIGSLFRGNFAPPVKTFFLSWPIAVIRYYL